MKIAFVGHDYHRTTLSSAWFVELLQKHGNVDCFWDSTWRGGESLRVDAFDGYDRIIIWQVEYISRILAPRHRQRLVFVPMWDAVHSLDANWWSQLKGVRIVSFCWELHTRLERSDLDSFHFQFFPDPSKIDQIDYYEAPRGFFWQRRPDINLNTVLHLSEKIRWDKFYYHVGMDPGFGETDHPSPSVILSNNIEISHFSSTSRVGFELAGRANIFFSPRLHEGIGMTFLEAMARGQCVVAPRNPTMCEYIEDGINGVLYNPADLVPARLEEFAELGKAARRKVEHGYEDWSEDRDGRFLDVLFGSYGLRPRPIREVGCWDGPIVTKKRLREDAPLVTVAIVVLNAEKTIENTIISIIQQDCSSYELIVIDGGSTDGTVEVINRYVNEISYFQSSKDAGPYFAMNRAAEVGRGEYIIFMNAGDLFSGRNALSRAFRDAPSGCDFIIGHHIYIDVAGRHEFHRAADFQRTWDVAQAGNMNFYWLAGIPCHQATITRRNLIAENKYDVSYRIAADHEFLYRMKSQGANFHHCGEILAVYYGGGLSAQKGVDCVREWWRIVRTYGKGADKFFRRNFPYQYEISAQYRVVRSITGLPKRAWKCCFGGFERSIRRYWKRKIAHSRR